MSLIAIVLQDEVLIAGFGRRGHAVGDIPGVRFKVHALQRHMHCEQGKHVLWNSEVQCRDSMLAKGMTL